ncbi:uncharacterized protein ASPGLDRAFT_79171 [Aspergillus glaucus CBS 516.65]|uniref:Uncharacterized protein n=1 Tax=Aspergillus glaucus CBS 516.65 TaxID=1160497 RepID=A0A1L9VXT6_ASPGL|nr:hypothetical protein ASPGLDRAFT_79171 [Aspergillus glaucus CBS 516.65]OJJ88715.1 hypothetical protein ASPGLDRAFT_79171 [Aspergillus glaucus CBS 516.65]
MSLYNEYQVKGYHEIPIDTAVGFTEEQLSQMAWFSLFGAIWQTGYLLNRYTFTSNPSIHLPIGPMGYKTSHWSDFDRDLPQTVLTFSPDGRGSSFQGLKQAFPVVCNTADIRDEVIAKIGRQAYYDDLQAN